MRKVIVVNKRCQTIDCYRVPYNWYSLFSSTSFQIETLLRHNKTTVQRIVRVITRYFNPLLLNNETVLQVNFPNIAL